MEGIFNACMDFLYWVSSMTGITYEQLNVVLFVFLHPAITLYYFIKYKQCENRKTDTAV